MRCIKEREVCNIIPGHLPLESLQSTKLVTWNIILKSPPWIWRWLTNQSKTWIGRIQLSYLATTNLQIYGGNFKLIGHMRSLVIWRFLAARDWLFQCHRALLNVKSWFVVPGSCLLTIRNILWLYYIKVSRWDIPISATEVQIVYM